jgi:hypothetical protein
MTPPTVPTVPTATKRRECDRHGPSSQCLCTALVPSQWDRPNDKAVKDVRAGIESNTAEDLALYIIEGAYTFETTDT